MTEEIIIDVTKCDFNTFDGGGSQRTICTLDNCYCDGIRAKDCYFKQLIRLKQQHNDDTEEITKLGLDVAILEQEHKELLEKFDEAQDDIKSLTDATNYYLKENKELKAYKDVNEDFKKAWDELNKKYTEVLKLAKLNADSNEYCLKKLEKENKRLKEEIQFHNKENSNLLAERNAAQIGYDEIREVRERYRSALEQMRVIADDTLKVCDDDCGNARKIKLIIDKINEALNHSEG